MSAIQHFPAGVVSAAAAGEVLPDLKPPGAVTPLLIGGTAGMSAMMAIMQMEAKAKTSVRLLATVAVDLFIDGLVLGLGYAAGATQGWLLRVALTIEILFFGLPVAVSLKGGSRWKPLLWTAGLVLLLPIVSLASVPILALPLPYPTGLLAFGLVALLYLVTAEVLVEAHDTPDKPWITAMFFAGFLLLLLLADLLEA